MGELGGGGSRPAPSRVGNPGTIHQPVVGIEADFDECEIANALTEPALVLESRLMGRDRQVLGTAFIVTNPVSTQSTSAQ
jgi:hypothetical protein